MTKKMVPLDVLCAGLATWDIVFTVCKHPHEDEKIFADGCWGWGGGPAANAAVAVTRLGGRGALIGYLGHDLYGQLHLAELQAEGVDISLMQQGDAPTRLAVVLVKPAGTRTVISWKGAVSSDTLQSRGPGVGSDPVPESRLAQESVAVQLQVPKLKELNPGVLLFDGHEPEVSRLLAIEARQLGIPVVLDAGSLHAGTRSLLPMTDYLVCSHKFAGDYCGSEQPEHWLDVLGERVPVVVVTSGEKGLIWRQGSRRGRLRSYPVEVVDTTGAGDAFHGAFALALAEKQPLGKCLRFASAAAALCCTRMGARPGCPQRREVLSLLHAHAGDPG